MRCSVTKILAFVTLLWINYHGSAHCEILDSWTKKLAGKMDSHLKDPAMFWNMVTLQAAANDYNTAITSTPNQRGPTSTSRAFAIIYGCIYEAYNYYYKPSHLIFQYKNRISVSKIPKVPAVYVTTTEAAYQALVYLYPAQTNMFRSLRDLYVRKIQAQKGNQDQINLAIAVGQLIASIGTNRRVSDGSQRQVQYKTKNKRGYYAKDPTNPKQNVVTPQWGGLKPFILKSASQFRPKSPFGFSEEERLKYISSKKFHEHFKRVKQLGEVNSKLRTADQTEIAIFWGYDGASKIGVPPVLYNQVAQTIATKNKNTFAENAQLFALVNYAMADVGIIAWGTKFYYDFPRPITLIRSGIPGIKADPEWTPLGAQPGNGNPSFTPPFPSYVSGHACFGSALFQVLRRFYKTDKMSFTLSSDEFNGKTIDSRTRKARPKRTRSFKSFKQAQHENGVSRVYLGVHWTFDEDDGEILGEKVANYVCDRLLK